MSRMCVNLENCYGIRRLEHVFEFDRDDRHGVHAHLIYAPNGAMKSSLAKVFEDIATGEHPRDRFFPDRTPVCSITDENGDEIGPEQILVVQPYDRDYRSKKQSTLLVNLALKKQHEAIHASIDGKKEQLLKQLKSLKSLSSGVKDIDRQLTTAFQRDASDFFPLLEEKESEVLGDVEPGLSHIVYAQIINAKVAAFLENPEFKKSIAEYIDKFNELVDASMYLKKGVFNHNNAATVGKHLAAQGFFDAEHSVLLKGDEKPREVLKQEDLDEIIEAEKQAILSNPELRNRFGKIDEALNNHNDLRKFRAYLEDNKDLIPELDDLDRLKKRLWISYLKSVRSAFEDLMQTYRTGKKGLERIASAARKEATQWERVVEIFKNRFIVPFELEVSNKADVILKAELPSLKFTFVEDDQSSSVQVSETELLSALSTGEERAYYILHMIFDVEAKILAKQATVLILDDISDSFDYKNKYAIVEYLKDIRKTNLFKMIILTHNFDFARTASRRVPVDRRYCYMTNKLKAEVKLVPGQYLEGQPLAMLRRTIHTNKKNLIAAIPFVRNLIEYTEGTDGSDYQTLTSLLHIKKDSHAVTTTELQKIYARINPPNPPAFAEESAVGLIYSEAEAALPENTSMNLENKIIWSIATRLKAEEFMVNKIDDDSFTSAIIGQQTVELIREYKQRFGDDILERETIALLDRVNLMTAENIHLNSFMIEPLLDLSDEHLKKLYLDVKSLNDPMVAKISEDPKDLTPA